MKINYGIMAIGPVEPESKEVTMLHFCGYEEQPTDDDFLQLTDELNTDPEFCLVGRIGMDVFLMKAPDNIVKLMAETVDRET